MPGEILKTSSSSPAQYSRATKALRGLTGFTLLSQPKVQGVHLMPV